MRALSLCVVLFAGCSYSAYTIRDFSLNATETVLVGGKMFGIENGKRNDITSYAYDFTRAVYVYDGCENNTVRVIRRIEDKEYGGSVQVFQSRLTPDGLALLDKFKVRFFDASPYGARFTVLSYDN